MAYFFSKLIEKATRANEQPQNQCYRALPTDNFGSPNRAIFDLQTPYSGNLLHAQDPNLSITQVSYQPYRQPRSSHALSIKQEPYNDPSSSNSKMQRDPARPVFQLRQVDATAYQTRRQEVLVTPQRTASSTLIAFVTALYNHLDQKVAPMRQGGLSPEKVGIMMTMGGYGDDENLCELLF
jgi:hypothetical protein